MRVRSRTAEPGTLTTYVDDVLRKTGSKHLEGEHIAHNARLLGDQPRRRMSHEQACWPVSRSRPLDERTAPTAANAGCGRVTLFVLTDWDPELTAGVELLSDSSCPSWRSIETSVQVALATPVAIRPWPAV